MDKTLATVQLIMAAMVFLCATAGVVCHIAQGHITSVFGYLVNFAFIYLSWALLRISYKELRETVKVTQPCSPSIFQTSQSAT